MLSFTCLTFITLRIERFTATVVTLYVFHITYPEPPRLPRAFVYLRHPLPHPWQKHSLTYIHTLLTYCIGIENKCNYPVTSLHAVHLSQQAIDVKICGGGFRGVSLWEPFTGFFCAFLLLVLSMASCFDSKKRANRWFALWLKDECQALLPHPYLPSVFVLYFSVPWLTSSVAVLLQLYFF